MNAPLAWPGESEEADRLVQAIAHWCECVFDPGTGERTHTCPPHQAFVSDLRWLCGLIFVRRTRQWYLDGEGCVEHPQAVAA
jgi:hypothetical protein